MLNIFNHLNEVKSRIEGKYLFFFFDFDGTLTPIVHTPDNAIISPEAKSLIDLLSRRNNCRIAIISGRGLSDIKDKIGLKNIIYSGNHGFEIDGPKIKYEFPAPVVYKKALQQIKAQLTNKLFGIKGVFIEDKKFSLALHYRLADKKDLSLIKTIFHESVILYLIKNKIRIRTGKMVLEVNPPFDWDKGKVVLWLLARQHFISKRNDILPIYFGDDTTDEDAFKVLKRRGVTVFVGKPGNSEANYYLNKPKDVIRFLRLISDFKV